VTAAAASVTGLGLLLAACTAPSSAASLALVRSEPLRAVSERVVAIADDGARRLVLTEQGASVVRGGAVERSAGTRRWRKAVLLPAADGRGTWAAGLDQEGRLWRVRPGVALDEIADRYGLAQDRIRDIAAAGGRLVVFLLDDAVAVADGRRVLRYPMPGARAVAGGGRVAAVRFADRVDRLALGPLQDGTAVRPQRISYPVRDPRAAVLDTAGVLFVATATRVYQAGPDGILRTLWSGHVDWLTAAGLRVWFADRHRVLLAGDGPPREAQGAPAGGARPGTGAADGSLWLLGQGGPLRLVPDRASPAEARWDETIRPIFDRGCAGCHRPDGRAGVDLSSAAAWLGGREEILQRVVIGRTMPPAGHPLSEDDRSAVRAWAAALWQSQPHEPELTPEKGHP
jgi:mono/diheme cytochrome c family protein